MFVQSYGSKCSIFRAKVWDIYVFVASALCYGYEKYFTIIIEENVVLNSENTSRVSKNPTPRQFLDLGL